MARESEDPLVGFHFGLDFQGAVAGFFTECAGLGSESDVVEQKQVTKDGKQVVVKVPGRLKWGDISLKRGITSAMDIWDWRKQVEDGQVKAARKNGSIIMYDQELKPVAQWDFVNAWPSKVSGPSVKSDASEFGIEELTIVHEYIVRKK